MLYTCTVLEDTDTCTTRVQYVRVDVQPSTRVRTGTRVLYVYYTRTGASFTIAVVELHVACMCEPHSLKRSQPTAFEVHSQARILHGTTCTTGVDSYSSTYSSRARYPYRSGFSDLRLCHTTCCEEQKSGKMDNYEVRCTTPTGCGVLGMTSLVRRFVSIC